MKLTVQNIEQIKALRRRCCTDLFFLAKEVLGKDLEEQPHREMCNFFVPKDPSVKLPTEGGVTGAPLQMRLLQCPRGSFKSTLNVVDAVQWTISYPNVRILVLTAEKELAAAFAEEYRSYFTVTDKDNPTTFQRLFPEFCTQAGGKEAATEFTTKARTTYKKEPTLWSNSIGSNLPGWHCDVLICDDVVTNKNAENPEQVEKIITKFSFALKLVDPGGYVNVIGTPYSPVDLYGHLEKNVDAEDIKILKRPAWTLKPGSRRKPVEEQTEKDFDLYFPKRLTYEFLRKAQKFDPVTFSSQYLIDARNSARQMFTEDLIRSAVIPWQAIPDQLSYYVAWDLAYGENMMSNYTTGIVAGVDKQGRLYIVEMVRGRFSGVQIAFAVADVMRRYPLQLTGIEDMLGAKWLEEGITEQATKFGVRAAIHYLDVERGKDAKINRIARLVPLFERKRIYISDGLGELDALVEGFISYTGSRNAQDDIPDAVSFFPRFAPLQASPDQIQLSSVSQQVWDELKRQELHAMLYPVAPIPVENDFAEASYNDYFEFPQTA